MVYISKNLRSPLNVISLGAGKQSSFLLIQALKKTWGWFPDVTIFADTQNEPPWTYSHLAFLQEYAYSKYRHEITIISAGSLVENNLNYLSGFSSTASSLPLRLANDKGFLYRQCTADFKIKPLRRFLKNIKPSRNIIFHIGISLDEIERKTSSNIAYIKNNYPLCDSRIDIKQIRSFFKFSNLPVPGKSSCLVCPFHSQTYWKYLKLNFPAEFNHVCDFDDKIRNWHKASDKCYLHRSCTPLRSCDLSFTPSLFPELIEECSGICGL